MKFIVIGLGYFGSTLAVNLTTQGHEVIGIDNRWECVDEFKDSITHVMEMDTTNEKAVRTLPLDDTDAVIVAIGEDVGSSILTLSILKKLNAPRIVGRVISPIHQSILHQIGITETVHPEEQTAYSVMSSVQLNDAVKVVGIDDENVLAQIFVPVKYIGHSIDSMSIAKRFSLSLIAVMPEPAEKGIFATIRKNYKADFAYDIHKPLKKTDILVLAGKLTNLKKLIES